MKDNNFVKRRDRISNDIHLFIQLKTEGYFHLKGYTRHILSIDNLRNKYNKQIFLTGYYKDNISHTGGKHSFEQKWYKEEPHIIANEIISQNPKLFELNYK